MIRVFKNVVISSFEQAMQGYPYFYKTKIKKDSVIFKRSFSENHVGFIELRIVNGRNYVIPNVYWSKLNRLPSETCLSNKVLSQLNRNFKLLDSYDEVMLSLCEFGEASSALKLNSNIPQYERLKNLYESEAGRNHVKMLGFASWPEAKILHEWDIIEEIFPNQIKQEDIHYATKSLIEKLVRTIHEEYVPYLEQVGDRLSE